MSGILDSISHKMLFLNIKVQSTRTSGKLVVYQTPRPTLLTRTSHKNKLYTKYKTNSLIKNINQDVPAKKQLARNECVTADRE